MSAVVFKVYDKVEGNYRGKGQWYPGRIEKVNSDGAYNIRYNQNDHKIFVQPTLLRRMCEADKSSAVLAALPFIKGTKVRVNFRGKGQWYPGCISRVHADGTFNTSFDDGEKETFVARSNIQLPPDPAFVNCSLKEGYRVEANFADAGKLYPAHVDTVHSDNTYDIVYEDGRKETHVQLTSLRQDTATITKCNDTYAVMYLDGRVETEVDRRRINAPPATPTDRTFVVNIVLSLLVAAVAILILVECVKIGYIRRASADVKL